MDYFQWVLSRFFRQDSDGLLNLELTKNIFFFKYKVLAYASLQIASNALKEHAKQNQNEAKMR